MNEIFGSRNGVRLCNEIISQCIWSDTYSSLKYIVKRTAYQLPLLVSFSPNNDDSYTTENTNKQIVFFFQQNVSKKYFLRPLQQDEDQHDKYYVSPKNCTFVMTDLFRGIFEFVINGHRAGLIHPNLEQLTNFASNLKCSIVFMSRDAVLGYYQHQHSSDWSSKQYRQGSIFRAERIHRSSISSDEGDQIPNDYLECHDEDGYTTFIKMDQSGRFTIIATSSEQQKVQPEIYLHSTQTPNLERFIKRVTLNSDGYRNCIRLVRGLAPHNFLCQYFLFNGQHTHNVLAGLTQEGLVVEWNIDCHVPCRYATNFDEIFNSIYGTELDRTLQKFIDKARVHYNDHFQYNIQLISTYDWKSLFYYWKWIDSHNDDQRYRKQTKTWGHNHNHFHLIASIQDLSDYSRQLMSAFRKHRDSTYISNSLNENTPIPDRKAFSVKQFPFLTQMSKLILPMHNSKIHQSNHMFQRKTRSSRKVFHSSPTPFDDSIYDSNNNRHHSSNDEFRNQSTSKSKRL